MKKYLVVFEKTKKRYSAYVPDLPGCITSGKTRNEIVMNIQKAIEFHIEGMIIDGEKIPEPTVDFGYVNVKPPVIYAEKIKSVRKRKVTA